VSTTERKTGESCSLKPVDTPHGVIRRDGKRFSISVIFDNQGNTAAGAARKSRNLRVMKICKTPDKLRNRDSETNLERKEHPRYQERKKWDLVWQLGSTEENRVRPRGEDFGGQGGRKK